MLQEALLTMLTHTRKLAGLFVLILVGSVQAAPYVPAQLPLEQLPQEHPYQRTLRDALARLTEKDLAIDRKEFTAVPGSDADEQFRLWLLTLNLPHVEAAAAPAPAFTLPAIESGKGLRLPAAPADAQMLAWLADWNYPGNPYHGSKALKRRAFVLATIDVVMLDYLYEHAPQGSARSDFLGGNLIWLGYAYRSIKSTLPEEARTALETGLKKHLARLFKWGPTGAMTDMDLFAPVGLWYLSQALDDPDIKRQAEAYARRLFTEERFFHPAGYFVDVGCFDTSYNGISLYFGTWAALASDWPFAREAIAKAYRLRAHLSLPDAGGRFYGPSHMSSRTSADPPHDQWNFPHRPFAAAMVTDEALPLARLPAPEAIKNAPQRVVAHLNQRLAAAPRGPASPWKETHWSGALNFAHDHCPKGFHAKLAKLQSEASQQLQPLYGRPGTFVRGFDRAFVIARLPGYAAVIHTGPIRGWPHGLGGGMLSAFWAPEAGPVLLGRRRGMQGPVPDSLDEWRTWPVHAVSGLTAGGELFSSAFLKQPKVDQELRDNGGRVRVEGPLAIGKTGRTLHYDRQFLLDADALTIETQLKAGGEEKLAELYETLPVFLGDGAQAKESAVRVRLLVGDQMVDADEKPQANVKAVRIHRYRQAIQITFDRPRSVKLSPREWTDGYQTRARCRTILIDLLPGTDRPQAIATATVKYSLAPLQPGVE